MTTATRDREAALDVLTHVRFLRREVGLSESELADATGASTRTVRRWTTGEIEEVQSRYAEKIDNLNTIVHELEDTLTWKGVRQWLRSRNRYLKGARPVDVLRDEGFERVHEAALAFGDGTYL